GERIAHGTRQYVRLSDNIAGEVGGYNRCAVDFSRRSGYRQILYRRHRAGHRKTASRMADAGAVAAHRHLFVLAKSEAGEYGSHYDGHFRTCGIRILKTLRKAYLSSCKRQGCIDQVNS